MDLFFNKLSVQKHKACTCNGLKRPKNATMEKVSEMRNVLNSYLKRFTKPENTSFSSGKMINVVISTIPNSWYIIMVQVGIELREMDLTNSSRT